MNNDIRYAQVLHALKTAYLGSALDRDFFLDRASYWMVEYHHGE